MFSAHRIRTITVRANERHCYSSSMKLSVTSSPTDLGRRKRLRQHYYATSTLPTSIYFLPHLAPEELQYLARFHSILLSLASVSQLSSLLNTFSSWPHPFA